MAIAGIADSALAQPAALQLRLDSVACTRGPFALTLPRHYPSLHGIGRHRVVDLETRSTPSGPLTLRRIEYIGLRLDLRLIGAAPQSYEMVELEVSSRRWNIGPLSVGQAPKRVIDDPALAALPDNGVVELLGRGSSIELVLRSGRIDRARYRCAPRETP